MTLPLNLSSFKEPNLLQNTNNDHDNFFFLSKNYTTSSGGAADLVGLAVGRGVGEISEKNSRFCGLHLPRCIIDAAFRSSPATLKRLSIQTYSSMRAGTPLYRLNHLFHGSELANAHL